MVVYEFGGELWGKTSVLIIFYRYNNNSTENCTEVPADIDETTFETVFYIGKGMGSMAAGSLAYV